MKVLLAIAVLFSLISVEASLITPDSPWGATVFGPAESQVGEILDSAQTAGFSWIRINGVPCTHG
jgi:hypothetical protein